jgi:hypothetical protein
LKRHSITAASAPSMTEMIVQKKAIVSELMNACNSESLLNAFTYQSVVKPCHTTLRRLVLKLNTMSVISGK